MYLARYVSVRTPAKIYTPIHRPGDGLMFSRMCEPILQAFLRTIGLPLEPDRYDYPGNLCAKIAASWERLETLLPSMEEVRAKHERGSKIIDIFECAHLIPFCLKSMDRIMKCCMSRRLSPDWREGFDNLSAGFDSRVPMTPKIRVLLVYVRRWVETFNKTMIAISEGPSPPSGR